MCHFGARTRLEGSEVACFKGSNGLTVEADLAPTLGLPTGAAYGRFPF
jgi:hypothetical protein